ncbi:hypothetical protein LSH36_622g02000 [Paralvinella palmiformis]|uniref:Uncharacterized protein n=1 Tax=Paralvinella palmiformis TaxID=53620 RepID=A0AAD9MX56_9ANNE|nr:hypothetical protein LSH36_622g02000 [Paralvinella palmiformis]
MTTYYFKNLAGVNLTDEERGNVPHPYAELITHVTLKAMQAGAILGAGVIGPAVSVAGGHRDGKSIQEAAYKYGKGGIALGLVVGPILMAARAAPLERKEVFDRSYRIRFNRNQVSVDRLSIVGALAGAGAAHFLNNEAAMGAVFGFAGGCVFGGLLNLVF